MSASRIFIPIWTIVVFLSGCSTIYQPASVECEDHTIAVNQKTESDIDRLLHTCTDSLNKNMNDVIAITCMEPEKKKPVGTPGNMLEDAMFSIAKEKYRVKADDCFIIAGSIRLNIIPSGNMTWGRIFEIAPFDNIIGILNVNDLVVSQQLLMQQQLRGDGPSPAE